MCGESGEVRARLEGVHGMANFIIFHAMVSSPIVTIQCHFNISNYILKSAITGLQPL